MKQSEFWDALEQVFGSALGHSLVNDLYLPSLGCTAAEAIDQGVSPDKVWESLVSEADAPEGARWIHRQAPKRRRA